MRLVEKNAYSYGEASYAQRLAEKEEKEEMLNPSINQYAWVNKNSGYTNSRPPAWIN